MRLRLTIFAALATVLGSTVLFGLFERGDWFWRALGAVLVVAAAGLLTRRLRIPAVLAVLVSGAVLIVYLTVAFAHDTALAGFVPTPGALAALGGVAAEGWRDMNHYAAPAPPIRGLIFLATTGVGVIAILVDLLAVRLRRAALTGVPLLMLFSVPMTVRDDDIGWVAFTLAAVGYLTLLVVDGRERVSRWGRPVLKTHVGETTHVGEGANSSPLAAAGRRIGLAAVAIAVLVPLAVPGLHPTGLLSLGGVGGHGTGGDTITIPDPTASLKGQLHQPSGATVLTYTTTDPTPNYLRIWALDIFAGSKWTMSRTTATREDRVSDRPLPRPVGTRRTQGRDVTTKISVNPKTHGMRFLPVPYRPARVDVPGDWRLDPHSYMVFSNRDSVAGRDYTVRSRHRTPTRAQLTAAPPGRPRGGRRYLDLPPIPTAVRKLAKKITSSAATPYAKAMAIQRWFTTGDRFTYSLDRPAGNGTTALADFLLKNRTGFCEQFAAAMAVLARLNEIPARVAIGYTSGTRGSDGRWAVTTGDAHAWPELYFSGIGWLRFEPTPSGMLGQGTAAAPGYATPARHDGSDDSGTDTGQADTGDTGGSSTGPTRAPRPRRMRDDWAGGAPTATAQPPQDRDPWLPASATVLLLIAVATAPRLSRTLLRRRRWAHAHDDATRAGAAWRELRDDLIDLGRPWRATDSPRAAARRITAQTDRSPAGALPDAARQAVERIALAEERARYAPTPQPGADLASDVRTVRRALTARATRGARWRARLLPPSVLRSYRRTAGRCLDVFAWLDLLGARLRGRLPHRSRSTR